MPVGARCTFLRAKLAQMVADVRKASMVEKGAQLVKVGYLANPRTMLRITAGNTLMAGTEQFVTRPLAAALDYTMAVARSAATGFSVPPSQFREINLPSVAGVTFGVKGFQASLAKGLQVMRTGVDPEQLSQQFDARRTNFGNPTVNRALHSFFDFVGAMHGVWYGMAYNLSLFNSAEVAAIREGLTGKARTDRVNQLLANPTDEMHVRALEEAQYAAFRNKTVLGDVATRIKSTLRTAGTSKSEIAKTPRLAAAKRVTGQSLYGVSELLMPFVQMPTAIAGVALDYSPVGFVKALALELPKETRTQGQLALRLARAGTGTAATFALGYALAKAGKLTGSPPASKAEKDEWDAEGKQPNSILVNGRWVSLKWGEPVTLPAILGANIYHAQVTHPEDTGAGALVGQTLADEGKSLSELPMLTGIKAVNDALEDPERSASRAVTSLVPIPSLVGQVASAIDPTARQAHGVGQQLASRIPGLSQTLPPKLDQFGRPIPRNDGGVPGAAESLFDITQSRAAHGDAVTQEIDRLRAFPGMPSPTAHVMRRPVTRSPAEYNQLLTAMGPALHQALADIIRDPQYQALSDEQKAQALKGVAQSVKRAYESQQPVRDNLHRMP